jgi:prepilin-type N-terminal cleavage/methylation domain-containing protein
MNAEKGFTLTETLVAIVIGLLVLLGIYTAVNTAQKSSSGIERKVGAQQDAKAALGLMEMEIRMASFNPNFATGIWINPATCTASANQQLRGIQNATGNSLAIEMDIDASSAIGDFANEIIIYAYDTVNLLLSRDVLQVGSCSSNAQPFLGDPVEGRKTVRVINNTLGIPIFRYYDGTDAEITSGMLPVAIPDIRRITITLAVETQDIDPSTHKRRRMIYTSSTILRNHH